MTPRTLTLQEFASLPPAWPEYIQGTCAFNGDGTGILIAHVHPICNRPEGDEDVLARALVFVSDSQGANLHRLTIRKSNMVLPDTYSENVKEFEVERVRAYNQCLDAIGNLPVLQLIDTPQKPSLA